jgi:anthraniloyl-CoA monooxygenase
MVRHVTRFWDFNPVQFAFGLMTRSKAITYDNLRLRAPDFVVKVDRAFAKQLRALGFNVDVEHPGVPLFQPLRLRDMVVDNRVVMSPMCMYSASEGMPTDWHFVHYCSRAVGGPGLIFTEMVCVSADARITPGCAGLWTDEQEAAWRRIVEFVHANSAGKICLQLGHAGRKGATKLMWDGMDRPLQRGRVGANLGISLTVLPGQSGAARHEPPRYGPHNGAVCSGDSTRRALRVRHVGTPLRTWLFVGELHFSADQSAHG